MKDTKQKTLTSEEIEQERLDHLGEMEDIRRRSIETANRFNKFCNENGVLSPFINPLNRLPADSDYLGYALIDYSMNKESVRYMQENVVEPMNEHYRKITGKDEDYFDICSVISHCFEKGLAHFLDDEFALEEYREELRNQMERWNDIGASSKPKLNLVN